MQIIEVLFPVLAMMLIGAMCRRMKLIGTEGIENLKFLVTRILLPVAIFHALATAEYDHKTLLIVLVMFLMILGTLGVGYLVKGLVKPPFRKYIPFMVSVYEGGMIGYPLYTNLCGVENLSKIAMLDIAGLLFGFSIYMGLLQQVEHEEKTEFKALLWDAVKNPAFIASVLGVIAGGTGVIKLLLDTGFGPTYLNVEGMITAPLTAMILLIVGYSLSPDLRYLKPCLQTVGLRVVVQGVFMVPVLFIAGKLFPGDTLILYAIVSYMSAPATFSMQSFLKTEEGSAYAATTNSLYVIVSILVYTVMAGL
ncbi:MAG: permease [Clostridiales bacterium]|nr:permease [Candidatus Blautia equi]